MNFIVVKVTKQRYVVAELDSTDGSQYKVCTHRLRTRWEACEVANELEKLDTRDYSGATVAALLDSHEEL